MLASQAGHVSVFFTDLLGMSELYNRPGYVDDSNWSLRVPTDFATRYRDRVSNGGAIDVKRCFDGAIQARHRCGI
jgi:4-alpha-glucanotransferase